MLLLQNLFPVVAQKDGADQPCSVEMLLIDNRNELIVLFAHKDFHL